MGLGLFDFSSESSSTTTVSNVTKTDSENRVTNNIRNMSESGNVTVTIPGESAPPLGGLASSWLLPVSLGLCGLGGLLLLRRR
jgi:hypothetical protein